MSKNAQPVNLGPYSAEEELLSLHEEKHQLAASILDGADLAGRLDSADLLQGQDDDVLWTDYTKCEEKAMTAVASDGRGTQRPNWEIFYDHYAKVRGLHAPDSQRFAEALRPEGGGGQYGTNSGGFDQLGFARRQHERPFCVAASRPHKVVR